MKLVNCISIPNKMNCCQNPTEIYRTPNGCVYQCDKTSRFIVDFAGFRTPFNVPCFLGLKRKVDAIDLDKMLLSTAPGAGIEIINPCGSDRIYTLSPAQAAEFKDLLDGTKVMLQLNSILKEKVYSIPVR